MTEGSGAAGVWTGVAVALPAGERGGDGPRPIPPIMSMAEGSGDGPCMAEGSAGEGSNAGDGGAMSTSEGEPCNMAPFVGNCGQCCGTGAAAAIRLGTLRAQCKNVGSAAGLAPLHHD